LSVANCQLIIKENDDDDDDDTVLYFLCFSRSCRTKEEQTKELQRAMSVLL